jgi:hypothetical protein
MRGRALRLVLGLALLEAPPACPGLLGVLLPHADDLVDEGARVVLGATSDRIHDRAAEFGNAAVGVVGDPLLLIASLRRLDGPIAAFASGAATGISPEILRLPLLDRKATIAVVRDQGLKLCRPLTAGPWAEEAQAQLKAAMPITTT